MATLTRFDSIGNTAVHYDRRSQEDYGTQGVNTSFQATPEFVNKLEQCLTELWELCPWGTANIMTTAGFYVDKPGMHGEGRAFDLDGLFWANGEKFITLYDGHDGQNRKFYLGIEAVLRKHFGTVLDWRYNEPHWDHFHVDDGTPVEFNSSSKSTVLFLQSALVEVLGFSVGAAGIDGLFGPNTREAVNEALIQFNISGELFSQEVWLQFLTYVAKTALN